MSRLPHKVIYLSPHCEDCCAVPPEEAVGDGMIWSTSELDWCQSPDMPDCEFCGKKPIRYVIDKRHLL